MISVQPGPNLGEYKAETCPTNRLSALTISDWRMGFSSDVVIDWSSVAGKTYRIQATTNLLLGFPLVVSNGIAATPGTNTCVLTIGPETRRFYRVVVEP